MSNHKENALRFYAKCNVNILPVRGKEPLCSWKEWQNSPQTTEEIHSFNWSLATGFAAILSPEKLCCIDIDKITDFEELEGLLSSLNLPPDYPWVVKSGSGSGAHIYFIPADYAAFAQFFGNERAVYSFPASQGRNFDHIELRMKNCYVVMPGSLHPSGGLYSFYHAQPDLAPALLFAETIFSALSKVCILKSDSPEQKKKVAKASNVNLEKVEQAAMFIGQHITPASYPVWLECGFALCALGKAGEDIFVKMSSISKYYADSEAEIRKKFNELLDKYDGRIQINTLFFNAKQLGWQVHYIIFWHVTESGKLQLLIPRIKHIFEMHGFGKLRQGNSYINIRKTGNQVEEIFSVDVKDFIQGYLSEIPVVEFAGTSREAVLGMLIKHSSQLFSDSFLEFLETIQPCFVKDTQDTSYIFYPNCFVRVTKDAIDVLDYAELPGCIWKNQKLERDFHVTNRQSKVADFFFNVCRSDTPRFNALKSALGYMLVGYKKPTDNAIVVLIDEKISDGQYGRSGKGLTIKMLQAIRPMVVFDGRTFDPAKPFAYQRVSAETGIIAIEDIEKGFPFEKLFSASTDGLTIERKNKSEVYIPHSETPKFIISTNFPLVGMDDSTIARQFPVEFSDHYNRRHTPFDEFGIYFLSGFSAAEWNAFDVFMQECIQFYLFAGLCTYQLVTLDQKRLITATSEEFLEYAAGLQPNIRYTKKEEHEKFKTEYPDFVKLSQRSFTGWLKTWAKEKGYKLSETRTGSERYFEFISSVSSGTAA